MADNFNDKDDELLAKLRKVLGFSSSDDPDDEDQDAAPIEQKTSADDKSKKAAFDTSVFDEEPDEPSPYVYDDNIVSFSDTLDRFFENSDRPEKKKNDSDETADFVFNKKQDKEEEEETANFTLSEKDDKKDKKESYEPELHESEGATIAVKDASETSVKDSAENKSITEKTTVIDKADDTIDIPGSDDDKIPEEQNQSSSVSDDRTAFNRTFATGEDETIENGSYNTEESNIMDSMQKAAQIGAAAAIANDLDDLFDDEYDPKKAKEQKKREKQIKKETAQAVQDTQDNLIEYTETVQKRLFLEQYKRLYRSHKIRISISLILGILLLLLEALPAFGVPLFHFISIDRNPTVYVLMLLQLFVLISACSFTFLADGIRSIGQKKIIPETLAVTFCILTLIYGIFMAFIASPENACPAFFSPCALCIISMLFYRFRALKREIMGFNIIASAKPKYILEAQSLSEECKEKNELFEFLPEDASAFKIRKTKFVNSFVQKSRRSCKDKTALNYILPTVSAAFIISLIILIILKNDISSAVTASFSIFALLVPSALFTGFSLPFYRSASAAFEYDSTILGEHAADEFASASIISLKDSEVFPSYSIKTSNLVNYNNSRIDYTVFATASVFKKIGGPLCPIFAQAAKELELTDDVTIIKTEHDGIEATVNSDSVLIGSAAFMERNDLSPAYSVDDENMESSNEKRVMYIASNGKINAKMHIKYTMNAELAATVKQLAKMGMCISVMTLDPNIDTDLLSLYIDVNKYPVRVIKCSSPDEMLQATFATTADIVSIKSPRALLQTLTLCKKLQASVRTNLLSVLLSVIIGIMAGVLMLLTESESSINSLYIVAYQIFWMLLSHLITFVSV